MSIPREVREHWHDFWEVSRSRSTCARSRSTWLASSSTAPAMVNEEAFSGTPPCRCGGPMRPWGTGVGEGHARDGHGPAAEKYALQMRRFEAAWRHIRAV